MILALAGAGLLLVLGGVGAAIWFNRSKPSETQGTGPAGTTGIGNGSSQTLNETDFSQVPSLVPRGRFKANFPDKGFQPLGVKRLLLNPSGSLVAVANDNEFQVWSLTGEPKKLYTQEGRVWNISDDGGLISFSITATDPKVLELETGKPTSSPFVGGNCLDLSGFVQTPTTIFRWSRSVNWSKTEPFTIYETDLSSKKTIGTYAAGDENRVLLAPPIKKGKELVFGVPSQNKVRVFDFVSRSITREITLADLKEYRPPARPHWEAFAVSPDGKWIAAMRRYFGKEPDVIELFDSNGAVVATLPPRSISDRFGAFLYGRDAYIGPSYNPSKGPLQGVNIAAFDIKRRTFMAFFRDAKEVLTELALSRDGRTMATGYMNGEVCIWDLTQIK